jgi:hypothetical protein
MSAERLGYGAVRGTARNREEDIDGRSREDCRQKDGGGCEKK